MDRRKFLTLGLAGIGLTGCRYWPDDGFFNPCLDPTLPDTLKNHDVVQSAWDGIDPGQVWDCHTHLIGVGDSDSGIYVNPGMSSLWNPIQYSQFNFYLDGACVADNKPGESIDRGFVRRLVALHEGFIEPYNKKTPTPLNLIDQNPDPCELSEAEIAAIEAQNDETKPANPRFMLLAFEYNYSEKGERREQLSAFHTPNQFAHQIAQTYPDRFEWIASIHPYREDCVEALEEAVKKNTRAVKWLPNAMSIDPSSSLCDRFYEALVRLNIPLLTHTGAEYAVSVEGGEVLGNPLLLRRALDHGVRVIFAHCASLGESLDIDQGANGKSIENLRLFARLMDDQRYDGLVYGDISAITQVNRSRKTIETIVTNRHWHDRLLNGSDYPLPGVMPVFSVGNFVDWGHIKSSEVQILREIRHHNPMVFDFVLKRRLRIQGLEFSKHIFETKRFFDGTWDGGLL